MIYDISHRTVFSYAADAALSQHLLHLAPRLCTHQVCHNHALFVEPAPKLTRTDKDFFGNPTTYMTVEEPHKKLSIVSSAKVAILTAAAPVAGETIAWDHMARTLAERTDRDSLYAFQFVFDSPFTKSAEAAGYAEPSFPPGRPILEGAVELMSRINADFTYEGGVTDIHTPVDQVLTDRHGVCQDFAHLQIACLRSLGLPVRYVSGYLLTHPPEGEEKKVGADASHAWLAVWIPDHGWVDLDPTNNMIPSNEHITVAWGRDYGDVSPINGMVLGGGEHEIDVAVDVRPSGG